MITRILLIGFAALACGGAVLLLLMRGGGRVVPLDVEFKLTDIEYKPLSDVPVRLVLGAADWQAPDAGVRVVTAAISAPKASIMSSTRPARALSDGSRPQAQGT